MSRVSFPTLRFRDLALAMDTSIYVAVLSLGLPWVSCSVAICPYPQDGRHPEMIAICISPFALHHIASAWDRVIARPEDSNAIDSRNQGWVPPQPLAAFHLHDQCLSHTYGTCIDTCGRPLALQGLPTTLQRHAVYVTPVKDPKIGQIQASTTVP